MTEQNDLGISLVETIGQSELAKMVPDGLDIALDSQLTDGILKELPIIKSTVAIYKTALGVRDFILLKKIILFLKETANTDANERYEFSRRLSEDKKYQRKVGEQLLLYIDRVDDIEKSAILGKLFNGYIKKEIDYDTFQRLANAVDKTFIGDLNKLKEYYTYSLSNFKTIGKDILHHLAQSGLVSMESHMILDSDGILFKQSKLGLTFIDLVFP